jgi:hypothetical protein
VKVSKAFTFRLVVTIRVDSRLADELVVVGGEGDDAG